MPLQNNQPLIIWRLIDGKPGHEKQTLGLANALARHAPVRCHSIRVPARLTGFLRWTMRRFPEARALPAPDLLIAAGHATHFPLLAARRARGGKAVVLMRPSLPLACFDLCLIPRHDHPPARPNVVATLGALNDVTPTAGHDPGRGLILLGGVSSHFRWDDRAAAGQVERLLRQRPDIAWTLTTSRRTPASLMPLLPKRGVEIVPAEDCAPGWLERQLARAAQAWVTPDSVSMLYEALTAGCRVGVFELPAVAGSRVAAGVAALRVEGRLSTLDDTPADGARDLSPAPFDEAGRCAGLILERWFR